LSTEGRDAIWEWMPRREAKPGPQRSCSATVHGPAPLRIAPPRDAGQTGAPLRRRRHSARAGKLAKRDGLAPLMRDAQAGAFDVVVVVDLDRLTRSETSPSAAR
jgi:hypothetical protein